MKLPEGTKITEAEVLRRFVDIAAIECSFARFVLNVLGYSQVVVLLRALLEGFY